MSAVDQLRGGSLDATFVPADPPRSSWFALWDPHAAPGGLLDGALAESDGDIGERTDLELVVPAGAGVERRMVSVIRVDLATAISVLCATSLADPIRPSVAGWAVAVRQALDLVARGRVLPWVSPDGWDTWRVDPLDASDQEWVQGLVRALPATAHAVPAAPSDSSELRLVDPVFAVRSCFDAVGDCLIRTPAAAQVVESSIFADVDRTRVRHLRPWVRDVVADHQAGTALVLRMEPPDHDDLGWQASFALRSQQDPSLLVDAADLWDSPAEVLARLGDEAEADLLRGLRRAGDLCAPILRALDDRAPTALVFGDDELDQLLDRLDDLADVGIDVRWPAELVAPPIERRLVVRASAPGGALPSVNDLDGLLSVDWEFLLDGVELTRQELAVLAEAKRAVVPLRGRWVRLDPAARRRLVAPTPTVGVTDVLAAALGAGPLAFGEDGGVDSADGGGSSDQLFDVNDGFEIRFEGAVASLVDRLGELDGARELAEPAGLDAELRPYQRRGLAWMSDLCTLGLGGCLADDMGLGKTVQVLALHALREGPTLVVCPTSVLANWERESAKFLPGVTVHRYHGAQRTLDEVAAGDLVVTTYGVVRSDVDELAAVPWDLVVADEAQHAKNPRSRTARSLRAIPSAARIALTGTPVENRLTELWSILDWAVPGLLGPLETFRRTTAVPIERDADREATNRLQQLIKPFLLRRRKSDPSIAPELPPKTERDVVVPLTPEQVTLYQATVSEVLADIAENDGLARHGLVLKLLTALKQITNHPAQFLGEQGPLVGRSGKLAALEGLVDAAVGAGDSTLIFSQYVEMGRLLVQHLSDEGFDVELLHGGLSIAARQKLVDRLQSGELPTLVLSLKAAGTGLNLTRATNVVHFDRWWNPAVEDQATDRAYRIGQDRPVTVHRLITEGTVEDRVAQLLTQKRQLADRVVGSGETWIGNLDDAALADLVTLRNTV